MKTLESVKVKLSDIATPDHTWMVEAKWRVENKYWLDRSARIAFKILETLKEKEMSQSQLAEKMGVSRQMISKIVQGRENLTLSTIGRLEQILEKSLL